MSNADVQRELRLRTRIDVLSDRLARAQSELANKRARCQYLTTRVRVLTRSRDHWRKLAYSHEERLARSRQKRS